MVAKVSAVVLLLFLSGCTSVRVVHDYCQIAKPIYVSETEAEYLSDETAREILSNNETWLKVCKK